MKTTERRSSALKPAREPGKAVMRQFTMLPSDVDLIEELRLRYQREAISRHSRPADIVKSEIIRAGIHALGKMSKGQLYDAIEEIEELKEGRRKKGSEPAKP